MASNTFCRFNLNGYCRYRDQCKYQHAKETCENTKCDQKSCMKRHPRNCKYYSEFGYCKFGDYCAFRHSRSENDSTLLSLAAQFESMKTSIILLLQQKVDVISKLDIL